MMKRRRSEIGGTELLSEPDTSDSPGNVVFVYYDVEAKERKKKILETLGRVEGDFDVAKGRRDKAEMKKSKDRMERLQALLED